MTYHLTWMMTGLVVLAAVIVGVVTAFLFRGVARTLWAILVSLAFVVVGTAAVLADATWMATENMRLVTQALALLLGLSGLFFAMRARD